MDVLSADLITCTNKDVKQRQNIVYENLQDPVAARRLFSRIKYAKMNEKLNSESLKREGCDYVFRIQKSIPHNRIIGNVAPASDPNNPNYRLEWTLSTIGFDWTRVVTSFYALDDLTCMNKNPLRNPRVPVKLVTAVAAGIGLLSVGPANAATSSLVTHATPSVSTLKIAGFIAILAVGGIFGSVYGNSYNALFEMETLITIANTQYENKQHEVSFDTFSKVDRIFLNTEFSPDHLEHAEYLHLQSLTGMGNSLQSQSNFGQIKEFSKKSEEYYLYAITLYEKNHDTENAWLGRGINAIYETPEKTLEYCSMFDSVNAHMCQGEAYSYMYITGKAPLEKAEEQFEMALDMAESESQRLKVQKDIDTIMSKVQKDIDTIYDYYKLPTE